VIQLSNRCSHDYSIRIQTLAVTLFISLKYLLDDNLGMTNEVDVLPLAKQTVDPFWIPGDWYLNQPAGYRLLFNLLIGKLIVASGFLTASIIGRFVCYGLVALGLVLIGQQLKLRLPLLLLAVGLFLYSNPEQGMVAKEWIVKALEAKSVAYGCVLIAIGLMLAQRYRWMSLLLGLATSFHVLVGGWAFLTIISWLILKRLLSFKQMQLLATLLLVYVVAGSFAIKPVLEQLLSAPPPSPISASFIYVFLRLPHHLNPLSWSSTWWIKLAAYLLGLAASAALLQRQSMSEKQPEQMNAVRDLMGLTLLSLIPFTLGLSIAHFDTQGSLLQFYPFRFGDVMLPLNTCLLFACALQRCFSGVRQQKFLVWSCISLLIVICAIQVATVQQQFIKLPDSSHGDPEFQRLCNWIRTQTPADATIVSPPVEFVEFTQRAERPTIAKYKLLPQAKEEIIRWYDRLSDLNGGTFPLPKAVAKQGTRNFIQRRLTEGYRRLGTTQAIALMNKYHASYFMDRAKHKLELPVAYQNSRYVLYSNSIQKIDSHVKQY
jgi:hypothetical protein